MINKLKTSQPVLENSAIVANNPPIIKKIILTVKTRSIVIKAIKIQVTMIKLDSITKFDNIRGTLTTNTLIPNYFQTIILTQKTNTGIRIASKNTTTIMTIQEQTTIVT